jgi:hypothetical protein
MPQTDFIAAAHALRDAIDADPYASDDHRDQADACIRALEIRYLDWSISQ